MQLLHVFLRLGLFVAWFQLSMGFFMGYPHQSLFLKERILFSSSVESENAVENLLYQADKQLGTKNLLQEISQLLFRKYPSLSWDDSSRVLSITFGNVKYQSTLDYSESIKVSKSFKKQFEIEASRKLLSYLYESSGYRSLIISYLSDRLNKDNNARVLSRDEMLLIAQKKRLAILVDTENISDFRKVFYISKDGIIRFSSEPLPNVNVAPPLTSDSIEELSELRFPNRINYEDDEILLLSYAHKDCAISFRANRLTSASGKDAADFLILYDLGALQRLKNLDEIYLVTADRFGKGVINCVNDDISSGKSLYPTLTLFLDGKDVARTLGRIY